MSVVQYIGARYVPKFYENPNGSNDWLSGISYEPLTIVTYASNSFTSKKPVPATVGNPPANPEYWVSTGIYNAQVEQIRQDISAAQEDIDDLETALTADIANLNTLKKQYYNFKGRKVLFIGDSFAQGWTPDGTFTGWCDRVISILNLTGSVIKALGGIGFVNSIEGTNFGNIADNTANKDTFTDIVICGGRNDATQSIASVQSAAITTINHYRTIFPNAVIHLGMICYCGEANVNTWYPYMAYKNAASETGAHYLPHTELCITNQENMASDKRHPNANGQKQIAECVAAGLAYDDYQVTSQNAVTLSQNGFSGSMFTKQTNELVCINWNDIRAADLDISISDGSAVDILIGTHNLANKVGSLHQYFPVPLMVGIDESGVRKYINVYGQIRLEKQNVYLRLKIANSAASGWEVGTLRVVFINAGAAVFNIWD